MIGFSSFHPLSFTSSFDFFLALLSQKGNFTTAEEEAEKKKIIISLKVFAIDRT